MPSVERATTDPPPWPFVTAKQAAQRLGVDTALMRGLANTPQLRAQWTATDKGGAVWLFCREDVDAMVEMVKP